MLKRLLQRISGNGQPDPAQDHDPEIVELRERWQRDGYLLVPGLFSTQTCDGILAEVERYAGPGRASLDSLVTVDILHGENAGRLMRAKEAPDDAFTGPFKLNNLFAESAVVQAAVFDRRLRRILTAVLGSEPLAINSLNFRYGSQQPDHIDSWYMPPPVRNSMAVASISLEDTQPDAGPVVYYPGSHLIEPYVFSHGGINAVDSEMPACRRYIESELQARGLTRQTMLARKGDVFIWHCQLLHGGSPITTPGRTRASLVVHYWGWDSVAAGQVRTGIDGGKMLDRDYLWSDGKGVTAPEALLASEPA
jgi:phytanoyl-CoA hydroxylase